MTRRNRHLCTCQDCGKRFEATTEDAQFCTGCKRRRSLLSGTLRGKHPRTYTCSQCGHPFKSWNHNPVKYCSDACRDAGTAENRRKMIEREKARHEAALAEASLGPPKNVFEAVDRFNDDAYFDALTDAEFDPTDIPPGDAKVAVLIARVLAGVPLWHPDDATLEGRIGPC